MVSFTSRWANLAGKEHNLGSAKGLWSAGETGLMAIETARNFGQSRIFFTCHDYKAGDTQDVRVARWHVTQRPRR